MLSAHWVTHRKNQLTIREYIHLLIKVLPWNLHSFSSTIFGIFREHLLMAIKWKTCGIYRSVTPSKVVYFGCRCVTECPSWELSSMLQCRYRELPCPFIACNLSNSMASLIVLKYWTVSIRTMAAVGGLVVFKILVICCSIVSAT